MEEQVIIKYVWLDENGDGVSPQYTSFRAAINFIHSYAMLKQRIETCLLRAKRRRNEREVERLKADQANLAKTGKDPVKLCRLVIQQTIEDPSADEQRVADLFLPAA